ncbi:glycerophosphodiester phosphodiesterase [Thauera humireducens]|uniref:glycerophosphodiester phosphodiesterase n=1 Tax=Thauera humireducens TaxID=1134435 RepID=UPI00311FAD5F
MPRALLIERLEPDCVDVALGLGCVAVVAHHALITARFEAWLRSAGLAVLAYTVNDDAEAWRLRQIGVHGLITRPCGSLRSGKLTRAAERCRNSPWQPCSTHSLFRRDAGHERCPIAFLPPPPHCAPRCGAACGPQLCGR